jgi:hypothetical protein
MIKKVRSQLYNYNFNTENGFFMRWGKNFKDDPHFSPLGPEILDIEISTICDSGCSFCYKSNTPVGKNMDFAKFKNIFHKIPDNLTQIAFGIGSIDSNPDLWRIMEYCRSNNYNKVVPHITINGKNLRDEYVSNLVRLCGAVAVSRYDEDICYSAVEELIGRGLGQVNIHQMTCIETFDDCFKVMDDYNNNNKLKNLNAIVFLLMKPKGNRNRYHRITSLKDYKKLIDYAFNRDIPIGFDSCSAPYFIDCIKDRDNSDYLKMLAEPCESNCFSSYINVDGRAFHCSFTEGEDGWEGVDVVNCVDFMEDVWFSKEVNLFRDKLYSNILEYGCRKCPIFNLDMR